MGEIIYHDFGYRPERLNKIRIMAEKILAIEKFFESRSVELDENVLKNLERYFPVFSGSMQTDLLNSSETDWEIRPEYFKRILDTFILVDPKEMQTFVDYKEELLNEEFSGKVE